MGSKEIVCFQSPRTLVSIQTISFSTSIAFLLLHQPSSVIHPRNPQKAMPATQNNKRANLFLLSHQGQHQEPTNQWLAGMNERR
jgi:hypothetical protein